jgi:hypothetical protein
VLCAWSISAFAAKRRFARQNWFAAQESAQIIRELLGRAVTTLGFFSKHTKQTVSKSAATSGSATRGTGSVSRTSFSVSNVVSPETADDRSAIHRESHPSSISLAASQWSVCPSFARAPYSLVSSTAPLSVNRESSPSFRQSEVRDVRRVNVHHNVDGFRSCEERPAGVYWMVAAIVERRLPAPPATDVPEPGGLGFSPM